MSKIFLRFKNDDSGATAIEYRCEDKENAPGEGT